MTTKSITLGISGLFAVLLSLIFATHVGLMVAGVATAEPADYLAAGGTASLAAICGVVALILGLARKVRSEIPRDGTVAEQQIINALDLLYFHFQDHPVALALIQRLGKYSTEKRYPSDDPADALTPANGPRIVPGT